MNHSELCRKWAHAAPDASRKSGSMSFAGDKLYSYSTPIAKIYRKRSGAALALFCDDNYSITTSKHIGHGMRAVSHLTVLRVPSYIIGGYAGGYYRGETDAPRAHKANLAHFEKLAASYLEAAERAMLPRNVEWRRDAAVRAFTEWQQYAEFFGIRCKAPSFPAQEWDAAAERAQRIVSPDPVRDVAKVRAKEKRQAAARAALQGAFTVYCERVNVYNDAVKAAAGRGMLDAERVQHWRDTGEWLAMPNVTAEWPLASDGYGRNGPNAMLHKFRRAGFDLPQIAGLYRGGTPGTLLRVNGEEIETSQGARVPLAAAPMVWALVQRVKRSGQPYTPGTIGAASRVRIGDYPLDAIDADGTLRAGCHCIEYAELARMAAALGLEAA